MFPLWDLFIIDMRWGERTAMEIEIEILSQCYVNRHKFVLSFLTDIEDIGTGNKNNNNNIHNSDIKPAHWQLWSDGVSSRLAWLGYFRRHTQIHTYTSTIYLWWRALDLLGKYLRMQMRGSKSAWEPQSALCVINLCYSNSKSNSCFYNDLQNTLYTLISLWCTTPLLIDNIWVYI